MKEYVLPIAAIFGSPALMLYGLTAFPPLDGNDPVIFGAAALGFCVVVPFVFANRRKLFPWGGRVPVVMWGSVVGFGACGAMAVLGGYLTLNGWLDREPPRSVQLAVARKYSLNGDFKLQFTNERGVRSSRPVIQVTRDEYNATANGRLVVLSVKPGVFGTPWVSGYQLR